MLGILLRSSWALSLVKRHSEGLNGVLSGLEYMRRRRMSVVKCWRPCENVLYLLRLGLSESLYMDKLCKCFTSVNSAVGRVHEREQTAPT